MCRLSYVMKEVGQPPALPFVLVHTVLSCCMRAWTVTTQLRGSRGVFPLAFVHVIPDFFHDFQSICVIVFVVSVA